MTTTGTGVYFDGQTSRRQDVHVALESELALYRPDGGRLVNWAYGDLRELPGPQGVLRLNREGGPPLARLEIRDNALSAAIRDSAPKLGASITAERGTARKVVLWSLAAVISLTVFGLYGIPAIATAATPLMPWSVDRNMGEAGDKQLQLIIPTRTGGFACGEGSQEKPGREALDRMAKRLSDAAGLPVPIRIVAVRSDFVNALALPGSPIYLFDGLIQKAKTGDEIAGVLGHEIGHVANRDGTRQTLAAGGASLLFGFILGDFVGGTAAITIVQVLSEASYSRDAERQADLYSVKLMKSLGADAKAVGGFLTRMTEDDEEEDREAKQTAQADKPGNADKPGESGKSSEKKPEAKPGEKKREGARTVTDWLSSHPATAERRKRIDTEAGDGPTTPVVDDADFLAIKRICGQPK